MVTAGAAGVTTVGCGVTREDAPPDVGIGLAAGVSGADADDEGAAGGSCVSGLAALGVGAADREAGARGVEMG